jgi:hypothetical protein
MDTACPSGSDATTCTCNGWPTTCDKGPGLVTTGAAFGPVIVQTKNRVTGVVPSVTDAATKNVPVVVGTPVMRPVEGETARPFGRPDAE